MGIDQQPPSGWTVDSLKTCISRSQHTEEALLKVHSNKVGHFKSFDICRQIIIYLSQKYQLCDKSVSHALILSYISISLNGPNGHKIFFTGCTFNAFWICTAVTCFVISVKLYETKHPRLKDIMYLLDIPYSGYARKFYKRLQLKLLMQMNWSLHFPTPIDFYECLKLKIEQLKDKEPANPVVDTITMFVYDCRVHCILSFCHTEWCMLRFSFSTMAVAAIAVNIHLMSPVHSSGDGIVEDLVKVFSLDMDVSEINECAKLMHKKVVAWMPKPK